MDNASKALVMAGGILIAMAIIGIAVAAYSRAASFAEENENAMSVSQIESFNRFYTAYLTSYSGINKVRCIDAVNILNRAVEDELAVEVRTTASVISLTNGFYTADPVNYVGTEVFYELQYNPAIGIIEKVIIY